MIELSIIDLIIENIFVFFAGAGAALLPFILEKGWRVYIIIRYRKIKGALGILYSEVSVGTLRFEDMKFPIQTAFKLSQLDEWKQVERVLTQIIYTVNIYHKDPLFKALGKERTELWLQKYEKWGVESKNKS